ESGAEGSDDSFSIEDAAAPGPAADGLQGGPEPGVVGEVGVGREHRVRRSTGQDARALLGAEFDPLGTDEVERPLEPDAIDDDPDDVAVAEPADRPAREGLGADMTDARAGRNTREPRVGQHRDMLAEGEVTQRGGDLEDFLHAGAHGPAADQDQDVAGPD